MNNWTHPVGSVPNHVVMLCLGESKRYYADILASHHESVFDHDIEVWTLNAGFRIWDHDLLFVMDDLQLEQHRWPQYGEDLMAHAQATPIITSQEYSEWPNSLSYPFDEVCAALRLQGLDRYFFNSVPYMIAYAIFIGVRKITLFGADYDHHSKLEEGRANTEWWIGFATAKGVDVNIIRGSRLMNAHDLGRPLYGYRYDPRIRQEQRLRSEARREHPVIEVEDEDELRNNESNTRTRHFVDLMEGR